MAPITARSVLMGHGLFPFVPGIFFFINSGTMACINPFLPLFYESKGLAKWQIGMIAGFLPFLSFVAGPCWGLLADRTRRHKAIINCLAPASVFLIVSLSFITEWLSGAPNGVVFFVILAIMSINVMCTSPISPLINTCALYYLGPHNKHEFGRHRLWGAVAWGIVALILGYVLSLDGNPSSSSMWTWNIYGYFLGMLCFVLALYFSEVPIPEKSKSKNKEPTDSTRGRQAPTNEGVDEEVVHVVDHQKETDLLELEAADVDATGAVDGKAAVATDRTLLQEIRLLLSSPKVCVYLFTVFIMGMGATLIGSFLFLFLQDLGGDQFLMGITLACTVSTEIPFFFFAGRLIKAVGVHVLILTAMAAYVVRSLGYAMLTSAWWVLPLEFLHGLTFGAMWAAGVQHTSNIAPRSLEATAQTVFAGLYNGLGGFVGATVGGWVYQTYGPRVMFGGMGVVVFCTMVLFFLSDRESAGRELRETLGGWRNRQARRRTTGDTHQGENNTNAADYSRLALLEADEEDA